MTNHVDFSIDTAPPWLNSADEACGADIKTSAEDFQVREVLGFEPSREGEHHFLYIEKTHLNTEYVMRQLAKQIDLPAKTISHSGLKDRHGVTQQWLSVHMPGVVNYDWQATFARLNEHLQEKDSEARVSLVDARLNRKKLQIGVHKANDFDLLLRSVTGSREDWEERLQRVRHQGFLNYFGAQRFGMGGNNIEAAFNWLGDTQRKSRRIPQHKRSLFLSTVRGYLFNQYLYNRLQYQSTIAPLVGDLVVLAGSRSQFLVTEENLDEVSSRCAEGDLMVSGPLVGAVRKDEASLTDQQFLPIPDGFSVAFDAHRLVGARRPLLQRADGFAWQWLSEHQLRLQFRLPTGSYATSLLASCGRIVDRAS